MQSAWRGVFGDILGAQKVIDGKAETASRRRRARGYADHPAEEAGRRLRGTPRGALCVVPETTAHRSRGRKRADSERRRPTTSPQYVPGERLVLERNRFYRGATSPPRRPLRRRSRSARRRRRSSTASSEASSTAAWVGPGDYRDRAAELRAQVRRSTRSRFLVRAGQLPPDVRAQHEPSAVPQEPEAPAGRQLRRRPQSAAARASGRSQAR